MDNEAPHSHIHEKFRHLVFADKATRISFLQEPRWVSYTVADKTFERLNELLNAPKRDRMPNLLLIGDSNNGKTTLIRRFVKLNGEPFIDENQNAVKPIITAESPPTANEKELYISLIERFAVPYKNSDSSAKLRYQAIHLFREFHVKMLVIDEFHSLLTGTARQQSQVMNAIKLLCNELQIPIIGVGTKDAVRVLHTDPQHASRFDVLQLPVWKLDSEFQKLLYRMEATLPLKEPSNLLKAELATQIHTISEGNLGNIHRLVTTCARKAIETGEERITLDIIRDHAWLKPTKGLRQLIG